MIAPRFQLLPEITVQLSQTLFLTHKTPPAILKTENKRNVCSGKSSTERFMKATTRQDVAWPFKFLHGNHRVLVC